MSYPKLGSIVKIVGFKHNGMMHREWERARVLLVSDQYIVVANKRTKVTESNGRTWYTREPAVSVFFPDRWYNVIGMLRADGWYYYCNIASPYAYEDGVIKYIDYDLDVKIVPNMQYRILDQSEYQTHKELMRYSLELDELLNSQMQELLTMIHRRKGPFAKSFMADWYQTYTDKYEEQDRHYYQQITNYYFNKKHKKVKHNADF